MTDNFKTNYIDAPWLLSEKACVTALHDIVDRDVHGELPYHSSDEVIFKKFTARRARLIAMIEGAYELAAALWGNTLHERRNWFLMLAQEKQKNKKKKKTDEELMEGFSYHASDDFWDTCGGPDDYNHVRFEDLAFSYEGGFWSLVLTRLGVRTFMTMDERKAWTPEKRKAADRWLLDFAEDKPGIRDAFIAEVRASLCNEMGWSEEIEKEVTP